MEATTRMMAGLGYSPRSTLETVSECGNFTLTLKTKTNQGNCECVKLIHSQSSLKARDTWAFGNV